MQSLHASLANSSRLKVGIWPISVRLQSASQSQPRSDCLYRVWLTADRTAPKAGTKPTNAAPALSQVCKFVMLALGSAAWVDGLLRRMIKLDPAEWLDSFNLFYHFIVWYRKAFSTLLWLFLSVGNETIK